MIGHSTTRGAVLLGVTLMMLIVLGLIALQLTIEMRRNLKITRLVRDDQAALNLARAAVARSIIDLKNDLLADGDPERKPYDALSDIWRHTPSPDEPQEMGEGVYWSRVVEEESKININLASVKIIYNALLLLECEEGEAARMAAAIVDWRDADTELTFLNDEAREAARDELEQFQQLTEEYGDKQDKQQAAISAENFFYGYNNRNEQILVLEELLEVWQMTPTLLYSSDQRYDPRRRPA